VRVGIRPDEVMLATHPIDGLSARHRIQGTLIEQIDHGDTVLCRVAVGENQLLVDVTPAAVRELSLKEGTKVWCFFKASAVCRL
ncbi:MAG: TOBE domain-containing protein, partial [Kiritimatiellaceae bacterium]|nr:TOBE domain-containing protein [Kiritimatiellaceae bacterium]